VTDADPDRPLRLVILGRQGSGKGTQCARLVEHFGTNHVSTGDMLRAAVSEGTELGRKAQAVMDAGNLVSDDIMIGIVAERLAKADVESAGVILDGFPRTPSQADALEEIVGPGGLDAAVNLDVPVDVVRARMQLRGRVDDSPEAIDRRLELYERETAPLLDWFASRGLLVRVDGLGSEDEVFDRLVSAIEKARK
jgi:adenylate kinase